MGKRPADLKPPAYLTPDRPVPAPEPVAQPEVDRPDDDPTRFGDWTLKGIAIDF